MSDTLSAHFDEIKEEEHKKLEQRMNKIKYRLQDAMEQMDLEELSEFLRLYEHRKDIRLYFQLNKMLERQIG